MASSLPLDCFQAATPEKQAVIFFELETAYLIYRHPRRKLVTDFPKDQKVLALSSKGALSFLSIHHQFL
jgi:hypothetical protein